MLLFGSICRSTLAFHCKHSFNKQKLCNFFIQKNTFVILDLTFGWIFAITFVFGNGADSFCLYRLYALQWWIMVYGFIFSGISADVICVVSCLGRNVQGLIKVVGKLLQIQASQRDNGPSFTCPYSIRWVPFPSATAAARVFFVLFFYSHLCTCLAILNIQTYLLWATEYDVTLLF